MKKYAYIRVSSKDQNIARQVEAMKSIGTVSYTHLDVYKRQLYSTGGF